MTGYSEEGDLVVLRMTREDYQRLLIVLGFATATADSRADSNMAVRIANSINRGNPNWTPYRIEEDA